MKQQVDKKIIGFDMDGVIIDHSLRKIMLAKKLGFKIKKTETPSEIIKNLLPKTEYKILQHFLYNHPAVSLLSPLMPGVKVTLSKIQKSGTPFFLISRRQQYELSRKLLQKHKLWPKYFNKTNTFFVNEISDKEKMAKKLGITHYVDDEKQVLNALLSVKSKFLFDSLGVFKNSGYTRVESWKELLKLI